MRSIDRRRSSLFLSSAAVLWLVSLAAMSARKAACQMRCRQAQVSACLPGRVPHPDRLMTGPAPEATLVSGGLERSARAPGSRPASTVRPWHDLWPPNTPHLPRLTPFPSLTCPPRELLSRQQFALANNNSGSHLLAESAHNNSRRPSCWRKHELLETKGRFANNSRGELLAKASCCDTKGRRIRIPIYDAGRPALTKQAQCTCT